jgi:membrane protease YdiL (CAAX protease family)
LIGNTFVVAMLLMWPPAIGAYVARRFVEGGNFADSGLRLGPPLYLVVGWLLPALMVALAMLLSLPVTPFDPNFTTLREVLAQQGVPDSTPIVPLIVGQIVQALLLAPAINGIFAFGEEFGWRGYLLPRLMQAWGPWPGLLAHGAIWGFWHAPLIVLVGYNYPQHHYLGVPLFVVTCVLLGTIFGWLRLASDSVLPSTVAHGAFNGVAAVPAFLLVPGFDTALTGSAISITGWVVMALVILVLWQTGSLRRAVRRG